MFKNTTFLSPLCLGLLLLLSGTALAAASDPQDMSRYDQCMEKASGVTAAMRDCEAQETERLDRILNASYKTIMQSSMDSKDKEALKALQRTWLGQRDKIMKILIKYAGDGTLAQLSIDTSYREILQSQTVILWRLAQSLAGAE
ncbi:MAG: DUF1311 domain-containing protein [Desulfovibrio sp.]|nr:DUF1311 domain-containing protein [Desulfovibrio sp.]